MDSQLFAGPVIGIFCSGLNAYCMQTGPLFLRISGSSGVLKVFLLERNRQLSCNPKKKKKKKRMPICLKPRLHLCQVTFLMEPLHLPCCCGQRMLMSPWTQLGKQFSMCMMNTWQRSLSMARHPMLLWQSLCNT